MRKLFFAFMRRGSTACGLGPLVLAVLYLVLHRNGTIVTLTPHQVCIGIFSLSALAFTAGGMNVIYQIERLPLMVAMLIHGGVLYLGYLAVYLVNGWLEWGMTPVIVFSVIFVLGYLGIWAVIRTAIKKSTNEVNEKLKKQWNTEEQPEKNAGATD